MQPHATKEDPMTKPRDGVSPELDELSCDLLGQALYALAEGVEVPVLVSVAYTDGTAETKAFVEDGENECLEGARQFVRGLADCVRYAIVYEGAVEDDSGAFCDALLLEFGERGYRSYSAYSLFEGRGAGDDFWWSDPAPAGELEPLL